MERVGEGGQLLVMATDPEAAIDLAAWAADAGHRLEERSGRKWSEFLVTKGASRP